MSSPYQGRSLAGRSKIRSAIRRASSRDAQTAKPSQTCPPIIGQRSWVQCAPTWKCAQQCWNVARA